MVRRHNRLLVAFYVCSDAILGVAAFVLAYVLRFESGLIPIFKGYPPFSQYVNVLPFVGVLVPFAFHVQGLYRLRRGRSRVDDFFAVFVGSILAVVFGIVATLYFQAYYVPDELKDRGAYEVSQLVWGIFLVLNVLLTFASRELVREALERRWRAGIGLKRILIAGSGELGRLVADKVLEHRELGYHIVGFVDDRAGGDYLGHRGLPILGTLDEAGDIALRERVDHLYVALPAEEHIRMLQLLDVIGREMIDVKVVPDLLQVIALRARLEDLDGIPIVNINDVPLQGFNAFVKRALDFVLSATALLCLALPFALVALLIRRTSPGAIFYRQERMGLDGKPFTIYKFRSMYQDAESGPGPSGARQRPALHAGRPLTSPDQRRRTSATLERASRRHVAGGPRPERPYFVHQFEQRIPQYMLRHKVRAGLTGWAQVNGWRGNTSIEKRIEYDLYYIENWSVALDIKIMWLTVLKGFFQKHAY